MLSSEEVSIDNEVPNDVNSEVSSKENTAFTDNVSNTVEVIKQETETAESAIIEADSQDGLTINDTERVDDMVAINDISKDDNDVTFMDQAGEVKVADESSNKIDDTLNLIMNSRLLKFNIRSPMTKKR